jgi:hypothetical protein
VSRTHSHFLLCFLIVLPAGPGRIERVGPSKVIAVWLANIAPFSKYIMPLLYLVVKRYLRIIKLACEVVLDRSEIYLAADTIKCVLRAVSQRIANLTGTQVQYCQKRLRAPNCVAKALMKHKNVDVDKQLERLAFGMVSQNPQQCIARKYL